MTPVFGLVVAFTLALPSLHRLPSLSAPHRRRASPDASPWRARTHRWPTRASSSCLHRAECRSDRCSPIGPPPQATTDQDGRFAFHDSAWRVPHRATADRLCAAERTWSGPYDEPLMARQSTTSIADAKGAVIAGRILGPSGEPQAYVHVMALRRMEAPAMPPRLIPAPMQGMQQTNDIGEFRLSGLGAGDYFVSACRTCIAVRRSGRWRRLSRPIENRCTNVLSRARRTRHRPIRCRRCGAEVGNISFMIHRSHLPRVRCRCRRGRRADRRRARDDDDQSAGEHADDGTRRGRRLAEPTAASRSVRSSPGRTASPRRCRCASRAATRRAHRCGCGRRRVRRRIRHIRRHVAHLHRQRDTDRRHGDRRRRRGLRVVARRPQ